MPCIRQSKRAFALSIVLWIVAALLLGIAFIGVLSKETFFLTKCLDDKLKTRLEAESVLEVLKFIIVTSDFDNRSLLIDRTLPYRFPRQIILDGRKYRLNKNITISLQDVSSMVNVFSPDYKFIADLATNNNEREEFYTIRDSIHDWIDSDNIVRLNGAEAAFYKLKKVQNFQPRNSPAIESVDELRLINGIADFNDEKWKILKKYLYYGEPKPINLILIDSKYLQKVLKLNFLEANMLKMYFEENKLDKFLQLIYHNKNYNDQYMGFALSFLIKIDIEVKTKKATSKISTMINCKRYMDKLFRVQTFKIY